MKLGDKLGKFIDLTGQKFGILTVLERAPNKGKILRFYAEERNKSKKTENGWEKLPDKEWWICSYIVKHDNFNSM